MNTFNIQLKSGNYLSIPAEYYPRYAHIVATKENLLSITPINRFEAFLKTIFHFIFNPTFAVLSIFNLSLCTPLLITNNSGNPKTAYYLYLFIGFVISYYITKIYTLFTNKHPFIDSVAENLGYACASCMLKPYDERMLKTIIGVNELKIRRSKLYLMIYMALFLMKQHQEEFMIFFAPLI